VNENSKKTDSNPLKTYLLEPVTLGEIIDRSILLLKDNAKDFFIITTVVYFPILIISIFGFIAFTVGGAAGDQKIISCLFAIIALPISILSFISWLLLAGGASKLTSERYNGNPFSYKETFSFILQNLLSLTGTFLLMGFYLLCLYGLAIAIISVSALTGNTFIIIPGVLAGLVVMLVAAYVGFSYTLVPQIVVIENKVGQQALNRSRELFHSSWDSVVKTTSLPFLSQMLVNVFTSFPYIGFLFWLVAGPLPTITLTILYYDIRINREAYDLEWRIDRLIQEHQEKARNLE
jgi:hypothetical protein